MIPREDYFRCKHCLLGTVVKIPEDSYSDTHWMCPSCYSTYTLGRYPVATEEAVRLAAHRKDKEDAEKYRALPVVHADTQADTKGCKADGTNNWTI